jgi:hypothetical protein
MKAWNGTGGETLDGEDGFAGPYVALALNEQHPRVPVSVIVYSFLRDDCLDAF